jgi:ubiquinol-cytochrome c reductase cytochrome c subunit
VRRALRATLLALAVACAGMAAWSAAAGGQGASPPAPGRASAAGLAERGRDLYAQSCATCHGEDLRGRAGQGPSLRGVGAAAVDFYVSTGRMPLANPTDEPVRADPQFPPADIAALVAYVGSFGGPGIPAVAPGRGSVARGKEAFTDRCAGCHQVVARGGIVTGAAVPSLKGRDITPRQLGEAVRIGPYLMPRYGPGLVSRQELDDLAAYVSLTRHPDDRGGLAIGNLGPVPEGLVAWLLAGGVLVLVARALGERERDS